MSTKQPSKNDGQTKQYGMDMSLPGAPARWKQILSWVRADLAPDNPEFATGQAPDTWKPDTKEERIEEQFLRRLLLAKTADAIGRACCPAFLIKGLASPEDEKRFGAVEIEEAFRRVAKSFKLTDAEAYQARQFADALNDKKGVMCVPDETIFTCAKKFNIIRQAVETARLLEQAANIEAAAETSGKAVARELLAAQSTKAEVPAARTASYPQKHYKLTVENSEWTQFRYDGVERLFDLGHRYKAAKTVKVMLFDLKAVGRANAKSEQMICKKAGISNGKIRSPFSDRSGDAPMFKEFFNLVIKNDGTRRRRYYLDIV